jgi:hypothetical protein
MTTLAAIRGRPSGRADSSLKLELTIRNVEQPRDRLANGRRA